MHPLWADVRAEGSEALPPPPDFSNEPPLLRWKSEDYEVCRVRFTGLRTSLMTARAPAPFRSRRSRRERRARTTRLHVKFEDIVHVSTSESRELIPRPV